MTLSAPIILSPELVNAERKEILDSTLVT